jgi:hypothetical protein
MFFVDHKLVLFPNTTPKVVAGIFFQAEALRKIVEMSIASQLPKK